MNFEIDYNQKISEAILGLAVGDAVGVPVEFVQPHILKEHPITEMFGGGSHNQPIGTWSDDTSMTLALIDALSKSGDAPDYTLAMKNFEEWIMKANFTAGEETFDVGRTCLKAIGHFSRDGMKPIDCGPKSEFASGNGALMRILPALFWCERYYGEDFIENPKAREVIHDLTSLTHGHERCLIASGIYLSVAEEILKGKEKSEAVKCGMKKAKAVYENEERFSLHFGVYDNLYALNLNDPDNESIQSSGYVVDTIEAALWAFSCTESFKDCIIKAINLGHDTDTVAAIAGGLAGMYYGIGGEEGIPLSWLSNLKKMDYIALLCSSFAEKLKK